MGFYKYIYSCQLYELIFFFNDTATTEIYTLSLHDALPICLQRLGIETIDLYYQHRVDPKVPIEDTVDAMAGLVSAGRSEEHTSELQSRSDLVCRLLLEKKNNK